MYKAVMDKKIETVESDAVCAALDKPGAVYSKEKGCIFVRCESNSDLPAAKEMLCICQLIVLKNFPGLDIKIFMSTNKLYIPGVY